MLTPAVQPVTPRPTCHPGIVATLPKGVGQPGLVTASLLAVPPKARP